jgi:AraC-like DNA-binding protein
LTYIDFSAIIALEVRQVNLLDNAGKQSRSLYVDSCGYQLLDSGGGKMNTYSWADYHILYIIEGTGYVTLGEKRYKMVAGNVLIFHPWQVREYGLHRNVDSRSYYLHFNGDACEEIMERLKLYGGCVYNIGISLTLTGLLDSLINEFRLKTEHYEYMCQSHLLSILTLISRKLSDTSHGSSEVKKRINEMCKYIYENCSKIESVSELAQMAHLSESRFSHLFSKTVGVSPKSYLLRAKIDVSKEILANTDLSIAQISASVGFKDQNYFSRAFKRFAGTSPTEYRRNFTEIPQNLS